MLLEIFQLFNNRVGITFIMLFYYFFLQYSKERGRITLKFITIIEQAVITSLCGNDFNSSSLSSSLNNSCFINNNFSIYPFQIGYTDNGQDYFLYLITFKEKEREDWIQTLRFGTFYNFFK